MKLINLLNVLDGDTKLLIQFNKQEIFNGFASEIIPSRFNFKALESVIKAVWYSSNMQRIVIEC